MARVIVCIACFIALTLAALFPVTPISASARESQGTSWTLMMYMADDTTSSLNWQDDLNEMEAAEQAPGTNVIALVDPYGPDNSVMYKVKHDPNLLDPTIVSDQIDDGGAVIASGEVDMADATTLDAFIEFSAATYPAEKYVLVLWGHGAGWRGLCPDGTDILNLTELREALEQATSAMGRPLDLVAVDSCAEANIEMMWTIRSSSQLLLASEKDVPFQGLPYIAVIDRIRTEPGQSVEAFAKGIAKDYVEWSASNTDYSVTMGVFNLSRVEPLAESLASFSSLGQVYDPIFNKVTREAFNSSEGYEEPYTVDFMDFMRQIQKADLPLDLKYTATQCMLEAEKAVVYFQKADNANPVNGVHVANATGLTVYAPTTSTVDASYTDLSLAGNVWCEFGKLLKDNTITISNGPRPSVEYSSSGNYWSIYSTAYPPNDTAYLNWSGSNRWGTIWVFRNQTGGLAFQEVTTMDGSSVVIDGYIGRLTLAICSYLDLKIESYRTVNITLEGYIGLIVQVLKDDRVVQGVSEKFDLRVVTSSGESLSPVPSDPGYVPDDYRVFQLSVPADADIGDVLRVEVIDDKSSEIVGSKQLFAQPGPSTVFVDIAYPSESPYRILVPLVFALLPGVLILGFALSLHMQNKRKKGDDGGRTRTSS